MVVGIITLWGHFFRKWFAEGASDEALLAAALCASLPVFQSAFIATSLNQWHEGIPFIGIVVACGIQLSLSLFDRTRARISASAMGRPLLGWGTAALLLSVAVVISVISRAGGPATVALILIAAGWLFGVFQASRSSPNDLGLGSKKITRIEPLGRRRLLVGAILFAVAGCTLQGIKVSWDRVVHDIFSESTFPAYMSIPRLETLKWGQPTAIRGVEFKEIDVATLIEKLKKENKPFFVLPDFTILYGIVGQPSPQPILCFYKGLTYPRVYDESLDRWVVDSLDRNKVEYIVLEKASLFGTDHLEDFPLLRAYVYDMFTAQDDIGAFKIRRRAKNLSAP
jgi:hypothetical protein